MTQTQMNNKIDCSGLTPDEINYQVKNLIFNGFKYIILRNLYGKHPLLEGLKGNVKLEILGNVSSGFANWINGPKITVVGDVGSNSACNVYNGKFTVFGNCDNNFGNNVKEGEFYIFRSCGKNSFSNLTSASKVVVGGQVSNGFAANSYGGAVAILNLGGGSVFIEDDWFRDSQNIFVYIRSSKEQIKASERFVVEETNNSDEDVYLPLISEFARLFSFSLSEIKSEKFYKVSLK